MNVQGYPEYFSSQIIDAYLQSEDHYLSQTGPIYQRMDLPQLPARHLDERIYATSSLTLPQPTGEKEPYYRSERRTLGSTPINPVKYTEAVDLTEESVMWAENGDDSMVMEVIDEARELPLMAHARVDLEVTDIWRLGHGNTKNEAYDGKPLFATDHPLTRKGGTQSNDLGNAALNDANLKKARNLLNSMQMDDGQPFPPAMNLCLMVGPELQSEADKYATALGNPETANNEPNYHYSVEILVNPWLKDSYSKRWYLIAKDRIRKHSLGIKWLRRPTFGADSETLVGYESHAVMLDFDTFLNTYQHSVGSKGA